MTDSSLSNTMMSSDAGMSTQITHRLKAFINRLYQQVLPQYASFSFPIEALDPLAYLEMNWDQQAFQYYWEKPADEFAIAAGNELIHLSASGSDRFNDINNQIEHVRTNTKTFATINHPYSGIMFLGGFSFFNHVSNPLWDSFGAASLSVPEWLILKDGKFCLTTINVSLKNFESPAALHNHLVVKLKKILGMLHANYTEQEQMDRTEIQSEWLHNGKSEYHQWVSSVQKAKKQIAQESFDKIVLARYISVAKNSSLAPTHVVNNLRQQYSNCSSFLIHRPNGHTFLGSTPERLGSFRNRLLLTDALAGSMKRGRTATEDSMLEKSLSASPKNQNEHNFVIKAIEERLAPFVDSVDRSSKPEVKKLSNVQHLYTPIRAKLNTDSTILDVVGQLHPTPAVGGYPWKKAAPYITRLETFDRGWYAGPVGWLNSKGTGEFAVAIRSGLLTEDEAHFFAGCGIVADSDPNAEWEETNLKLKPMLSALQYD